MVGDGLGARGFLSSYGLILIANGDGCLMLSSGVDTGGFIRRMMGVVVAIKSLDGLRFDATSSKFCLTLRPCNLYGKRILLLACYTVCLGTKMARFF